MEVTEVKVKLVEANRDRLKAYCTITLDGEFVIRDLKLIEGSNGLFVAMPSRKLGDRCPSCGGKNHLRARYCNHCGGRLDENRAGTDREGRPKLHADIAHPINSQCRHRIQKAVEEAYRKELEQSTQPGYKPAAVDVDDEEDYNTPPGDTGEQTGETSEQAGETGEQAGETGEQAGETGEQAGEAEEKQSEGERHKFGEGIF